ncbi:MAG: tyrosine-type recombinase/integrase [Lachnospiraceae bacterium]|nr:tyrosine-type recombinase/integrase [Lachnospiraceae bacterium]MBQ8785964.1 tyrosine-type recombinase/integrase [Alphaproteobacteria bacterium]
MTGSLQEKNGKYYAVINLTDINGKRKQKWISTGYEIKGNKKKAEQFLRNTIKEFELKENLIPTDILFSDYVKHWLETIEKTVDVITLQGYESVVKAHIVPYFEAKKTKLAKMNKDIIQEYIDIKHQNGRVDGKGGLSPKTLKTHRLILNLVLKEAVKNDLIGRNPCEFVNVPKMRRREATFYTISQLESLFNAVKEEALYPLIYTTVIYGLRRSEVLGLKWDSVDFEAKLITIKHTVVKVSEVVEKDVTKTDASHRSFPLTDEVIAFLNDLKNKERANKMLFGKEYIENDYVFKWDNGQPYSPDYITHKFADLLKKYNLPHIRFHDLRHSCASLLIAKGFTLKDIQEWLGHSDFRITANVYAHLDTSRKENIAKSMSNTFKTDLC